MPFKKFFTPKELADEIAKMEQGAAQFLGLSSEHSISLSNVQLFLSNTRNCQYLMLGPHRLAYGQFALGLIWINESLLTSFFKCIDSNVFDEIEERYYCINPEEIYSKFFSDYYKQLNECKFDIASHLSEAGRFDCKEVTLSPLMNVAIDVFETGVIGINRQRLIAYICYLLDLVILGRVARKFDYTYDEIIVSLTGSVNWYKKVDRLLGRTTQTIFNRAEEELRRIKSKQISGKKGKPESSEEVEYRTIEVTKQLLKERNLTDRDASIVHRSMLHKGFKHDLGTVRKYFKAYLQTKNGGN